MPTAAEGQDGLLNFFWAVNGQSFWHTETVRGPRTAYSAPAITVNGNFATISVAGASGRLKFFWAVNGMATGHAETVAGPGSVAKGSRKAG